MSAPRATDCVRSLASVREHSNRMSAVLTLLLGLCVRTVESESTDGTGSTRTHHSHSPGGLAVLLNALPGLTHSLQGLRDAVPCDARCSVLASLDSPRSPPRSVPLLTSIRRLRV